MNLSHHIFQSVSDKFGVRNGLKRIGNFTLLIWYDNGAEIQVFKGDRLIKKIHTLSISEYKRILNERPPSCGFQGKSRGGCY